MGAVTEDTRELAERLQRQLTRVGRHQDALLRLAITTETDVARRLDTLLRVGSDTLDVARVSFWRLDQDGKAIRCVSLWRTDVQGYEDGLVLRARDFPRYFAALHRGTVIVADDAHVAPQTSEFSATYLEPLGIGAMMDVPVYVRGRLEGVICLEHVGGARAWATDEQLFATSICQLLSLALESAERLRAEEALRESEVRFRAIAEVSPVPLIVTATPGGECLWANDAACRLAGITPGDLLSQRAPTFYKNAGDREVVFAKLREHGRVEGHEVELKHADGTEYWGLISLRPMTLDGRNALIVSVIDLTEQKRLEDVLRRAALHDALTGLPNREVLYELLRREIGRAERDPGYRFAVLYLDLDDFKGVNDQLGHDVGDQLLIAAAGRLRDQLRPMDGVARMGGDEFAVLLTNLSRTAEAHDVVARLEASLDGPYELGPHVCRAPASIGLVYNDASHDGPDALLRAADQAMYEKKRARHASHPPALRA